MRYISTRGGMDPATFSEVLIEGLAPDGGLVVPETMPTITREQLEAWRALDYHSLAAEVIGLFATDIPTPDLTAMVARAYSTDRFVDDAIVPLTQIDDDVSLLGLSEGPTLAFKDIAMQFLGEVVEYVLQRKGGTLNIVGATSGDTGSAAEYAFRDKDSVAVFMLSPKGRMSDFQRAQMYSLTEPTIHNIAMEGVFDDAQNHIKALAGDLDFKRRYRLGAVNSINLGRVTAQIVYYVWAFLRLTDALSPEQRESFEFSVTVPSGNFGNILAGHFAKSMGVPVRRLILASNENNVLDEFFRTGIYRPRASENTYLTSSPSMDISKASNLERFIFDLVGRDGLRLREAWAILDASGELDFSDHKDALRDIYGFASGSSTHDDRVATIRETFEDHGVLIDPHTADGVKVAREHLEDGVPMLVLETAKPAKFSEIVIEATGKDPEIPEHLQYLLSAEQRVVEMANDEQALRDYVAEHALL
ncbi:threonine synthase [uncultured Agrococcus sp.]|uniref:threonine synthase n=1 Tax=uncultured Agrococcus sp. TaxID=382258 RepID=UPI0025F90D1A|nr:threonine synthase [uncultured Agrococcus sp.]